MADLMPIHEHVRGAATAIRSCAGAAAAHGGSGAGLSKH